MIKKIIKSSFWIVTILPLVFMCCSCILLSDWHHMSHFLYQADVIFEDNKSNKVFCDESSSYPMVYAVDDPDYQKGLYINKNTGPTNYERVVANSKYIITTLSRPEAPNYYFIMVFDKSYNPIKTINFEDDEEVLDIACTEGSLYIYLKNVGAEEFSLFRYDFDLDLVSILIDRAPKAKSYEDDDVRLFFIDYWYYSRICKYEDTKTRLYKWDGHFKTDKIDLSIFRNGKNIVVENENKAHTLDPGLNLASNRYASNCYFYSKAYLFGNQLVFAIYKKSAIKQCASGPQLCICSLQESYLYKYDLSSNELSLVKEFEKGTFLIDYDLDGYKYYRDGGLYINDVLFRECENIYPEYVEHLTNEEKMYYYFSYYNGEFYGI